jgi:hypothetical protein
LTSLFDFDVSSGFAIAVAPSIVFTMGKREGHLKMATSIERLSDLCLPFPETSVDRFIR